MPCLIEARARSPRSANGSFSVVLTHVGVPKLGIVPFAQLSRIDLGLGLRCLSLSEQRTLFLEGGGHRVYCLGMQHQSLQRSSVSLWVLTSYVQSVVQSFIEVGGSLLKR